MVKQTNKLAVVLKKRNKDKMEYREYRKRKSSEAGPKKNKIRTRRRKRRTIMRPRVFKDALRLWMLSCHRGIAHVQRMGTKDLNNILG